ncbi:MAG: hypothetical protein SGPRY_012440 [Prymnesium sp.]
MPLASFTTQVLLLSTGGGLVAKRLRLLLGVELEGECPVDLSSEDLVHDESDVTAMAFGSVEDAHQPSDEQHEYTMANTLRTLHLLQSHVRIQLETRTWECWLWWLLGAFSALMLVLVAKRYMRQIPHLEIVIKGSRFELLDRERSADLQGRKLDLGWMAKRNRSDVIAFVENVWQEHLLRSSKGIGVLVVNA